MHDRTQWTLEQHLLVEYEADCAYWQGFRDGYARCDADLVAALVHALGGPDCHAYREAVGHHHRDLDRRQARAAWDATAPLPRPDDFPGRAAV